MNTHQPALIVLLSSCLCMVVACDGDTATADLTSGTTTPVSESNGGDGQTDNTTPTTTPTCNSADEVSGTAVTGYIYHDDNQSDVSNAHMGIEDGVDGPLDGETVKLVTWGGTEWTATTCADGSYGFPDLIDGAYLIEPDLEGRACRSRNCPRRIASAVRNGALKVVTMGDSVPVVGDQPTFPDRLAALLSGLAPVNNANIAVGGTRSVDWLPGTYYCDNRLLPEVADADVLVISLGGNDILHYVNNLFSGGAGLGGDLVGGAMELVVEIVDNVMETVDAVREVNPTIDVVYCLYPNYGEATTTSPWNMVGGFLGKETMIELLDTARGAIPYGNGLILADMYASFEGLPLDDYLYDSLHFNHKGATMYAEVIFEALGGVFVGDSPLPPHGNTPLGVVHDFGVTP